jgi:hypothetical protein
MNSLLKAIRDRNQTSHAYQEAAAERISIHIQEHFHLMKTLAVRLSPHIESFRESEF